MARSLAGRRRDPTSRARPLPRAQADSAAAPSPVPGQDLGAPEGCGGATRPGQRLGFLPIHSRFPDTQMRNPHLDRQVPGPGPPCLRLARPLRRSASEFGGCRGRGSVWSAPIRAAPPAPPALPPPTHLGPERPEGSVPRGPGPRRWPSSGARAAGYSPGGRGGRRARTERCGRPGTTSRGRLVFGRPPPRCPPLRGVLASAASRGTEGGGSECRPPAWAVAVRRAGGASAVVFEPRSPKQQPLGGGEGEEAGAGRPEGGGGARRGFGGAGFWRASPDAPSSAPRGGDGGRGESAGEKRAGATGNAKLFN